MSQLELTASLLIRASEAVIPLLNALSVRQHELANHQSCAGHKTLRNRRKAHCE